MFDHHARCFPLSRFATSCLINHLYIECVAVILKSSRLLLVTCYVSPVPGVSHQAISSQFLISVIDDFLNVNPSFSIIICGDLNRFYVSDVSKNVTSLSCAFLVRLMALSS